MGHLKASQSAAGGQVRGSRGLWLVPGVISGRRGGALGGCCVCTADSGMSSDVLRKVVALRA